MYLAPRCRLICARCSRRSGLESVHLRFSYVSWVQIDVSQIGLFSERSRRLCASAAQQTDPVRAVRKDARAAHELVAPRKAGPGRNGVLHGLRAPWLSRWWHAAFSRARTRSAPSRARARRSELGSAFALRAGGLGRRGLGGNGARGRARALLPESRQTSSPRQGAPARASAHQVFDCFSPQAFLREAAGRQQPALRLVRAEQGRRAGRAGAPKRCDL